MPTLTLAKPNLAKIRIDDLSVYVTLPASNDIGRRITDIVGNRLILFQFWTYSTGKNRHAVSEEVRLIRNPGGDVELIECKIFYNAEPDTFPPEEIMSRLKAQTKIVDLLCEDENSLDFSTRTTFTIPCGTDEKEFSSSHFFILPVTLPSGANPRAPITQIRGIRGSKAAPEVTEDIPSGELYQFLLDRPENEDIYLTVNLERTMPFASLIPVAVAQSLNVARDLGLLERS